MQSFSKKKEKGPLILQGLGGWGGRGAGGRRHYALSLYLFPFLKVSFLTFVVQTMAFQAKLPRHCVFKVMQHGYETVLSLNCKII